MKINDLRRQLQEAEQSVIDLKRMLANFEQNCQHNWSIPVYDPIVTEGYRDPGDAPGTMGVDFRGPMYIPGTTTPRWKRTCLKCGKIEATQHTTQQIIQTPKFRD